MRRFKIAFVVGLAVCASFALTRALLGGPRKAATPPVPVQTSVEEDASLQAVATAALNDRDGAIVIVDPQTGRVRSLINPGLAVHSAFSPGSTIKPFTTLAALRTGTIDQNTRMRCRQKYKRADVVDSCVHPPNLAPFNPTEALAHSCNYYFATVGERLAEDSIATLLADFGFGQTTGFNTCEEVAGTLARGRWQPESAIGEGAFLQVTPIQLAAAYAALFNGGKLFELAQAPAAGYTPRLRTQLQIDDAERSMLLAGMRGAVTFGTAAKAGLDSLPVYVAGKTGTATPLQGFRSQGWFAGVAFASNTRVDPANAQLVVVVYLKKGHGAEAAEVARAIFAEFGGAPALRSDSTYVSVKQTSENVTHEISLEDYILRVVSSEASVEDQREALKALAIAARTYALKNIGRHKEQGHDFCSTTHCQRFELIEPQPAVVASVRETAGLVLKDQQNNIADSYFSASCGGMTANVKTLWGTDAPGYLRGVRDDYCNSGSHYRWTDTIAAERLANALRNDPRTDVGQTVREISVARYDQSGRAELVTINGDRRREISGWEFKLIVGRSLGWNLLKSSRFVVVRSGSQFVFRGGGFGHGLGLCQEGSHTMAQRGHSFQQILAHYFPGTSVSGYRSETQSSLRSSHFRLIHPKAIDAREAERLLSFLESSRTELLRRVSAAGVQFNFPNLEVVINESTGNFVGRTGMPAWAAAATQNNRIELQPLQLLKQRRILETTLRHELVHVLVDAIGGDRAPRWLAEGMALYVAGEGRLIEQHQKGDSISPETVEQQLVSARSASEMRTAYAAAYKLVRELIRVEGENKVWKRLADRSYSVKRSVVPTLTT